MQGNITKHEVNKDTRSNVYMTPSTPKKPNTYDYQSLSRDQVDSYVLSALPDNGIEIDHNNREPDDSVHDARTKQGVIRTNLITYHIPNNNLITHPVPSKNQIKHPVLSNNLITHPFPSNNLITYQ